MNTYTSSYPVDTTYSYAPYTYSNYYSPSTSYCPCCSSTASYCPQQMQSSTSTSPVYFNNNQNSPSTTNLQVVQQQALQTKTARLQYSNKDRYILNELFQRMPYPNAIQRDLVARQLGKTSEQIRIWFQNRRRLQTLRDSGERSATTAELTALQLGKTVVDSNELKTLLRDVSKFKNVSPRVRLDETS